MTNRTVPREHIEHVEVPLWRRVDHLLQSLLLLRDGVRMAREGHVHHIATLSGQLRALLTDRSKGAKGLLFEIAPLLGWDLTIYAMRGAADDPRFPAELRADLVFASTSAFSLHRQFPGQEAIALDAALDFTVITAGDIAVRMRDVINWYADKAGGAHYARRVERRVAVLLESNLVFGGLQPLQLQLLQFAETVLHLGVDLTMSLISFDLALAFAMPRAPAAEVMLLDLYLKNSPMRVQLFSVQHRLHLVLHSTRAPIAVATPAVIPQARPVQVVLQVAATPWLETEIAIAVDGNAVVDHRIPSAIPIIGALEQYDAIFNPGARAPDGGKGTFAVHASAFANQVAWGDRPPWVALSPGSWISRARAAEPELHGAELLSDESLGAWLDAAAS